MYNPSRTPEENQADLFDALIAQGGPSMHDQDGLCMYRGPDGRRCAAGMLIDDKFYNAEEIERRPAAYWEVSRALLRSGVREEDLEWIGLAQEAHDRAAAYTRDKRESADWRKNLTDEWVYNGLSLPKG